MTKISFSSTDHRLTAADFHPDLLELYDGYVHGDISKRQFLAQAGKFAVGGISAAILLTQLSPNYAWAEQVSFNDPDIRADYTTYPSPQGNGTITGYQVTPTNIASPSQAILVIHENRGLNPYIKDVTRRLAKAGFVALAPDGLSSVGGYPGNDEAGKKLQKTIDPIKLMNDFFAGYEMLADQYQKVGAVGFCYGGGVCNALAVAYPSLNASVPYYGRQAQTSDVARIKAPLLLHYAENDKRINAGWPDYEQALKQAGKTYQAHIYPGVSHGFHNDSTPRYDQIAAELSWQRTLDFFNKHLG